MMMITTIIMRFTKITVIKVNLKISTFSITSQYTMSKQQTLTLLSVRPGTLTPAVMSSAV